MKLRRTFAVLVIPLIALVIAACGDDSNTSSGDASGNGSGDPVKVALVLPALTNPYWVAIKDGAEAEAERLGGEVELSVSAGPDQGSAEQFIAKIQDAQTRAPDAMVIAVSNGDVLAPTAANIVKAGIPVIAVNATLPDSVGKTTYIGTEELNGGADGAEAMKRALPDGGKVGILHCLPGNPTTDARVKGFKDGIAGTDLRVVSVLDARCDEARTPAVMNDMLTAHPDIAGVYSVSDNMTVVAQRVIENVGKDVAIVGYDAQPPVVELIKAGKVYASVAQFPTKMGAEGVRAALAAARGEPVEERIDTGTLAVTRDNLAEFEAASQR